MGLLEGSSIVTLAAIAAGTGAAVLAKKTDFFSANRRSNASSSLLAGSTTLLLKLWTSIKAEIRRRGIVRRRWKGILAALVLLYGWRLRRKSRRYQ